MAISSVQNRGLIYAGDTPLACSIYIAQTGPMQLTVRGGSFTSTGAAKIRHYAPETHDQMIVEGKAEMLPDGQRVREWAGVKAVTYVLKGDCVVNVTSDHVHPATYGVDLVVVEGEVTIQVNSKGPKIQTLVFPFVVPPGCKDLSDIPIYVLKVLPGFPPGTGPEDWRMQSGEVSLG